MKANAYDLQQIFGFNRQFFAPLFQRSYVWEQEKQWEPLWNDIRIIAERLLRNVEADVQPHFMGAVVLEQIPVPVGKPDSRSVIDGQQRLTTIQLLLVALRDFCNEKKDLKSICQAAELLIFNNDPMSKDENDRFKVWPTNMDRPIYRTVMTTGSPKMIIQMLKDKKNELNSRILRAYEYFFEAISAWVLERKDSSQYIILRALLNTIREKIKLVVIDMDKGDNSQIIFETLNARGTPLLPSDLVKNFLFRRAEQEKCNVNSLYDKFWKPFENKNKFWRSEVRQGRLMRPRIDIFLQHYLALMRGEEVPTSALFSEFQKFVLNENKNAEWHLQSLNSHSERFHYFFTDVDGKMKTFFYNIQVMDTSTVIPLLLGLYAFFQDKNDDSELLNILKYIESYLVRRMVCGLTSKDYNHLFLELLVYIRKKKSFTQIAICDFLVKQTAESRKWPDDNTFEKEWLEAPLYRKLQRARLRMILKMLDENLFHKKGEKYKLTETLTIEHVMPKKWDKYYPIPRKVESGLPHVRDEFIKKRNNIIHSIGNLALLTKALNPAVSNGAFNKKKTSILKHSAINLNRFLLDEDEWNEKQIRKRGQELFKIAKNIWPYPKVTSI